LLGVAVSPNGERMMINFTAVEGVLSLMHGATASRAAMMSRLKYLRHNDFPSPPSRRGKGQLGMDEALKIATAFELIAAGLPPTRAARLIRTDWEMIRVPLALSWWRRQSTEGGAGVLVIQPDVFAEIAGAEIMSDAPLSETLGLYDADAIAELLGAPASPTTLILIDLGRMAERFLGAVVEADLASADDAKRGMLAFCGHAFGSDDRTSWPVEG